MARNYTLEKIKFKVKEGYYKTVDYAKRANTFLKENPEVRNTLIAMGMGFGTGVVRTSIKAHKNRIELNERETRIWDPRMGMYYNLRKPMSPAQKLEYTRRFSAGENGAEILRDIGVKFF